MILDVTLKATCTETGHTETQSNTWQQLYKMGLKGMQWISGRGSMAGGQLHTWRVAVTEEEATLLRLKCVETSTKYQDKLLDALHTAKSDRDILNRNIEELETKLAGDIF